ncbi:MAG: tyrosine-type recombinase/integrase [Candidatus Melainabacteria bacterium]|nr:tyrosine-type recombinase/integrase [Candidatus Melainabacteria bacterium]
MTKRLIDRIYFTDDVVHQLQHNFSSPKDFTWYQDEAIPELRLRVSGTVKGTRRTWYFYATAEGRSRSLKLGDFPRVTARDARAVIEPMLRGCEFGEDPKRTRPNALKKRVPDYRDVFAAYLRDYIKAHKRAKEARETEQSYNRCHQRFASMRMDEITRADIQQWVNELGEERGGAAANREFRRLQGALHYGEKMEMYRLDVDPTKYVTLFPERSRTRYLSREEMQRLLEVLRTRPIHQQDIVMLALGTAARKGNVLAAEWAEIDFDAAIWRIPAHKYKTNRETVLPLHSGVLAMLKRRYETRTDERWVFPSESARLFGRPSKTGHITQFDHAWKSIQKEGGLDDVHFHDLRHTVASWLAIDGASAFVIMEVLGHSSISTTKRYTHLNKDASREAMQSVFNQMPVPAVVAVPDTLPAAARAIDLSEYRQRRGRR